MRRSSVFVAVTTAIGIVLFVMALAVQAQNEVPPAYAGLKNPFSWNDASAQDAGKKIYQQSCLGCHGVKGDNIAAANFGSTDFAKELEESPDSSFWILSEGALSKGMPPFKSSLSDEKRWQVLTYLWSLGKHSTDGGTPPTTPPSGPAGTLSLSIVQMTQTGRPLTLTATLLDAQSKPVENSQVTFFVNIEFFASGLMDIGDALTDDKGVAVVKYLPRQGGNIEVVARGDGLEAQRGILIPEIDTVFYESHTGIKLPTIGKEVFIGPKSSLELEDGNAPTSAFRLPGGLTSWLLLAVGTVIVVWGTYFRVVYQVFRIPIRAEIRGTDTRLVPMLALAFVFAMGIFLVLKLLTGPYTHLNLIP